MSYDPLTNNQYICANNQFTAQENVSPPTGTRTRSAADHLGLAVCSRHVEQHVLVQDRFNGATYVNGVLTGGTNPGYTKERGRRGATAE